MRETVRVWQTPRVAVGTLSPQRANRAPAQRLDRIAKEVRVAILERVADGVPAGTAAMACGVGRRTFQRWLQFGRLEDAREPYRSFARQVDEAFAAWQVDKVREIDGAGAKDWRASSWLLERRAAEDWTDPNRAAGSTTINVAVLVAERRELSERLTVALAAFPEALAAAAAALSGGEVVDGVVVAELDSGVTA